MNTHFPIRARELTQNLIIWNKVAKVKDAPKYTLYLTLAKNVKKKTTCH